MSGAAGLSASSATWEAPLLMAGIGCRLHKYHGFFTRFKRGQGACVCSRANKILYQASPGAQQPWQLCPTCTNSTGFLWRYTRYALPALPFPRLLGLYLIFNLRVTSPAVSTEQGEALLGTLTTLWAQCDVLTLELNIVL